MLGLVLGSLVLLPVAVHGQSTVRQVSLTKALEEFADNSLALKIARSETAQLAGAARQSRAYVPNRRCRCASSSTRRVGFRMRC